MDFVLAEFDHKLLIAELDERETLSPWQNVILPPAVITGFTGLVRTVTGIEVETALQPKLSEMVTK